MFYKKELADGDDDHGYELGHHAMESHDGNKQVEQALAHSDGHQADAVEGEEASHRFVLDLEVDHAVEEEAANDAAMIAYDVGNQIMHSQILQKSEHSQIHTSVDHPNQAVQDEIFVFKVHVTNKLNCFIHR